MVSTGINMRRRATSCAKRTGDAEVHERTEKVGRQRGPEWDQRTGQELLAPSNHVIDERLGKVKATAVLQFTKDQRANSRAERGCGEAQRFEVI